MKTNLFNTSKSRGGHAEAFESALQDQTAKIDTYSSNANLSQTEEQGCMEQ